MTLKFRAWDKGDKKMLKIRSMNFEKNIVYCFYEDEITYGTWERWGNLKEFEIMQFIGLKDKNGLEIFEGDIVEHKDGEYSFIGKVIKNVFGTYVATSNDYYNFEDFSDEKEADVIVIGNIYENCELLKK